MQRILFGLLTLLALAGPDVGAADWPDFPFIFVTGDAIREVKPDIAKVSFTVKTFDKQSEQSLKALEASSGAALHILSEAGVKPSQIEAFQVDKRAVRQSREYRDTDILGYECSRSITVTISPISSFGPIVEQLLKLDNVAEINPTFDVANRTEIDKNLTIEATQSGIERAGYLAHGTGAVPGAVFAISEEPFNAVPGKFALATDLDMLFEMAYKRDAEATYFVPSTITLRKKVNLIIKTTPKAQGK